MIPFHLIVSQRGICNDDFIRRTFCEDGFPLQFGVLDVFFHEWDGQNVDFAGGATAGGDGHAGMEHRVELLVDLCGCVGVILRGCRGAGIVLEADAEGLCRGVADGLAFFEAGLSIAVHAEDMFAELTVAEVVDVVGYNEE